ncbi:SDR family NAD(P)-dependent oxidoreductase [Aldersonia sp. NBC_00410]|uniref:SDR family NAD(P)-dependent oxidoreductase n=1 Tax=Aldersonia sp. NBC_00410 TaxID=2975954 RepID=UPI00225B8DE8|nr:SDR family NAD(P)-dependent oxidoreductase [Aldersonia sp. NBC_00410]MCX5043739.1 SDR family NAD(P)-dependent oxidoreductase [Aldersonia sp. NBC_00410]
MQLRDRVVLVTGASTGIGRAIASQSAARGAHVLVHGRDHNRTHRVAAEIGGFPLVGDLSRSEDLTRLRTAALDRFGRVDVLVNNAGVGWAGPLTSMTPAQLRQVIEVDLLAALELSRALLPAMVARGEGAICFVSSIAGRTGVAGEAVYSAAKAGIDMFAESLRAETTGTGVHVGVVVPGVVRTGFFDTRGRPYTRSRPRPVPPDDVAAAVLRTVTTGRAEAWVPGWLRIAPAVRALAPGPYRWLSTRFGEQVRVEPEPTSTDSDAS